MLITFLAEIGILTKLATIAVLVLALSAIVLVGIANFAINSGKESWKLNYIKKAAESSIMLAGFLFSTIIALLVIIPVSLTYVGNSLMEADSAEEVSQFKPVFERENIVKDSSDFNKVVSFCFAFNKDDFLCKEPLLKQAVENVTEADLKEAYKTFKFGEFTDEERNEIIKEKHYGFKAILRGLSELSRYSVDGKKEPNVGLSVIKRIAPKFSDIYQTVQVDRLVYEFGSFDSSSKNDLVRLSFVANRLKDDCLGLEAAYCEKAKSLIEPITDKKLKKVA